MIKRSKRIKQTGIKAYVARVLSMVLFFSLSFQMPFMTPGSYAASIQDLKLNVTDTALKVNLSYLTSASGQLYYIVTEDSAQNFSASEIEALAASGTNMLANGSTSLTYGGGPLEMIIDISSQSFVSGKAYKLQAVLKEGSTYSPVSLSRFFKGGFIQQPQIETSLPNGFNVRVVANIPGTIHMAMIPYDQPSTPPTTADLVTASPGYYFAEVKSGIAANTSMLLPLWASELLQPIPYKTYYTFVDAYGAVHSNSDGSAFSLPEQSALGNTLDGMYYQVGNPSDHTDDQIIVKCGTGVNNFGDQALYALSFESSKGTISAEVTDFTLGKDGYTLYLNLAQSLVDKLYDSNQFDGGTFSLSVASGGTLSPQFIPGYDSLTTPLTVADLATSNGVFFNACYFEDNGTPNNILDDYLLLSIPGSFSTTGSLVIAVSEGDVRGYSSTVTTLIQDTDYFLSVHGSSEAKITFSSTARETLNQMSYPALKITPAQAQWDTMTLAMSGNSAIVHMPSTKAALSQASIDGRPVQSFDAAVKDYYNVPVSYSKFGISSYLESAAYGSFIPECILTPVTTRFDIGQQKLVVNVFAQSGFQEVYTFSLAANTLAFKSLKVNGQNVLDFHSNMAFATALLPTAVTNPTIEATFENESMTLAQLELTMTGTLPGEKTYRYSIPGYPDVGFTLLLISHNSNDNPSSGGESPGTVVTPPPPVTETVTQITSNINTQAPPTEVVSALGNLQNVIEKAQNEDQVYNAVKGLNNAISSLSNWLATSPNQTPENNNLITQQLTQLTTQVASGLERISYPVNALQAATPYVQSLSDLRQQRLPNQTAIDSQVEQMITRLSDRLGTVTLPEQTGAGPVAAPPSLITQAIENQSKYMTQINTLTQGYFAEGSRSIPLVITLAAPNPEPLKPLQVELPVNMPALLQGTGVDSLRIDNGLAGLTVPSSLLGSGQPTAMQIQPTVSSGSTLVNFEVLQNNTPVQVLSQPVTLSFNLSAFGLSGSDWSTLAIYRLNPQSGQLEAVGGRINTVDGTINVLRGSLSQYTVMKSSKTFSDADQSWAKAEINAALNKGIVAAGDKFEPKAAITRAEFASWIAKAYGLKASGKALPFKDVPKSHAYYAEIAAIYEAGLIDGKSKTLFDPNGTLSASELAVILGKTLVKFDNKQTSEKVTSKHLAALKSSDTASWAQSDMALLQELGFSTQKELAQLKGQVTKEVAAAAFMKAYQSS